MVPIAIYPMVEVLKLVLSNWIWSDDSMKDEKGGCDVWNSNILEELGQVHFIFSDKTGTLTQNKMIFKKFSVDQKVYPNSEFELSNPNKDFYESEASTSVKNLFKLITLCHKVYVDWENEQIKF